MVSRIIDQYVDDVTQQLPIGVRRTVERDLKDIIYQKLDDYTEGQRAVSRDVRVVLREMGSPDEIADLYYVELAKRKKKKRKKMSQSLEDTSRLILGAGALLIVLGMVLLITGVTSNVMPIMIGAVLALGVMLFKTFGPVILQIDAERKKPQEETAASGEEDEEFFWLS